jgi:hypothetical protein
LLDEHHFHFGPRRRREKGREGERRREKEGEQGATRRRMKEGEGERKGGKRGIYSQASGKEAFANFLDTNTNIANKEDFYKVLGSYFYFLHRTDQGEELLKILNALLVKYSDFVPNSRLLYVRRMEEVERRGKRKRKRRRGEG